MREMVAMQCALKGWEYRPGNEAKKFIESRRLTDQLARMRGTQVVVHVIKGQTFFDV